MARGGRNRRRRDVRRSLPAGAWVIETRRAERWERIQQRELASLVAAWGDSLELEHDDAGDAMPDAGFNGAYVYLRNASELPVTGVRISVLLATRAPNRVSRAFLGEHEIEVLPPDQEPKRLFIKSTSPGLCVPSKTR